MHLISCNLQIIKYTVTSTVQHRYLLHLITCLISIHKQTEAQNSLFSRPNIFSDLPIQYMGLVKMKKKKKKKKKKKNDIFLFFFFFFFYFFFFFFFFAQNIDCGHTLEPPRQGGSNAASSRRF